MVSYIKFFSSLTRREKVCIQMAVDAVLIVICFVAAMAFRLESLSFISNASVWVPVGISIPITLAAFRTLGLYRSLVRYITGKILLVVGKAAVLSALALLSSGLLLGSGIPRSVPFIYAVFLVLSIGGLRFVVRYYFRQPNQSTKKPVLIYGAGDAGLQLLNSLFHGRDYAPVALVDDDPGLQRLTIGGLGVFAPGEISRLADETEAKVILLAVPSMTRARRREIVADLEDLELEIKTIPGMSEIISGKAKISELRNVTAEDLLGRDPVAPDRSLLSRNTQGKVVMVSGAGGSIGGELCRQILLMEPTTLVLFDVCEYALYAIESELAGTVGRLQSATRLVPILGSVQHPQRLEATIEAFHVETIYHAAAYKHVPLVEENVVEGIRNNVFGTLAITAAARKLGVENFILISTDKAVRPTNIMGATKRIAELICQAHAKEGGPTVFSMVRFGNVLGSSGSVIPRFREQIESGGPVTVTHREINRYFMTIPEASQLVIQAGAMAKGGDVFVLDMGQPVRIMDLAMSMIKLHGLVPYMVDNADDVFPDKGDIPVYVAGLRKGEKLYEELLIGSDPAPTQHSRIMTASEASLAFADLRPVLDRLLSACEEFDLPEILRILHQLPLQYAPMTPEIADLFWSASQKTECEANVVIKELAGQ